VARADDDPLNVECARLAATPRGRRALSWILLLGTLTVFLLAPAAASLQPQRVSDWVRSALQGTPLERIIASRPAHRPDSYRVEDLPPATAFALDASWDPGPLASPHAPWSRDCKACHASPFARVRNTECEACHRDGGDHVRSTQESVQGLTDQRCTACHRDHRGPSALAAQNRHFTGSACAECHGRIETMMPQTATRAVRDFATSHPEFRLLVRTGSDEQSLARIRPDGAAPLRESTTLKFPHDTHLDPRGIASPTGDVRLACGDCHVAAPVKGGFEPVRMSAHCQDCHALRVESRFAERELPHGPVPAVLSTLREFYAFLDAQGDRQAMPAVGRQPIPAARPGREGLAPRPAMRDPRSMAAAAAVEVFEKTSCVTCHVVSRRAAPVSTSFPGADLPQWDIAPIPAAHDWMPQSTFDHEAHASAECGECHAADASHDATEVLMPRIAVCRECHAGSTARPRRVTSDCGLCHDFHSAPAHTARGTLPPTPPALTASRPNVDSALPQGPGS
jgi:hypothetical protein